MKSKIYAGHDQTIIGDAYSTTIGFIMLGRSDNHDNLFYAYANGASAPYSSAANFFLNLDDQ
jgi:hypothetical protein